MRVVFALVLLLATLPGRAQLNNWDPSWYTTDSTLVFHDDLDYYLNAYSKNEIRAMRGTVSMWRMNFDKMMRQTYRELRTYSEGGGMQPVTHDFDLPLAQQEGRYRLREHDGRIRAFMFGSISNPPARIQLERWSALGRKYAREEVDIFVIYGRELHPGEGKGRKRYPLPQSGTEKLAYAKEFAALGTLPVLVDDLNDAVYADYGKAPNGAYLVDKDGNLVFRSTWADARKMEHMIDTLLRWYKAGRPKEFKGN
jgi:hypothetical protein